MRAIVIAAVVAGCGPDSGVKFKDATANVNAVSSCAPDACWTYGFHFRLANNTAEAVTGLSDARFYVGGQILSVAEQKLPCHDVPWQIAPGTTSGTIDLELQSYPTLPGSGSAANTFGYPCGAPTTVLTFAKLDGKQLTTAPLQIGVDLTVALDAGDTYPVAIQLTATQPHF